MSADQHRDEDRFLVREEQKRQFAASTMRYVDETREVPIQICDISASGAGFVVNEAPRLRSTIIVTMTDQEESVERLATIRWTRSVSDGEWRIGCSFSGQRVEGLAGIGSVVQRESTDVDVVISRQLRGQERIDGRLVNLADGGVCLRTTLPFTAGENLMVEWDSAVGRQRVIVRVHWARKEDQDFMTGCGFVNAVDMEQLQHSVTKMQAETIPSNQDSSTSGDVEPNSSWLSRVWLQDAEPRQRRQWRPEWRAVMESAPPGIWAGCTFVYGWVALNLLGFWPPNA